MLNNKKIVVVLPAYNAAQTLAKTYNEIPFDIVDDVILVDDASKDNTSELALIKNGKSNSARTKHIAVRFFFIKDRVDNKEIVLEYLCTEEMLADYFTKPLQGKLFRTMRNRIMNLEE